MNCHMLSYVCFSHLTSKVYLHYYFTCCIL